MPYLGESAALATALVWAISVVYFRQLGGVFSPLSLNFWKGIISIVGLLLIYLLTNQQSPTLNQSGWLLLSGVIGIGIGDTAFFAALNRMGERSTLLVAETLAPIFTALLAIVWISEWLTAYQWLAIGVILFGVDWVLRQKKEKVAQPLSISGLSFAAIAALSQAVGAVIGRDVLVHSSIDSVTASLIRLVGGLVFILPVLTLSRARWFPKRSAGGKVWKLLFVATFLGTFVAMILQMYSFAHAEAAIVQSLFASCIIFSLGIARMQGQPVSAKALTGSLIASLGVALIFVSSGH